MILQAIFRGMQNVFTAGQVSRDRREKMLSEIRDPRIFMRKDAEAIRSDWEKVIEWRYNNADSN